MMIDWIDYVENALKHGEKISSVLSRIENALTDIFDREYSKIIVDRLKKILLSEVSKM